MTEPDHERQARERVRRSRAAQGLPERVTDVQALARVAALLSAGEGERSRPAA